MKDEHITISNETVLILIKFKIQGNLRFLSHAEMMKVFERACIRAGIKVVYSRGFNPHPKLSLPLPKSVGIEVDDDLLCLPIEADTTTQNANDLCDSVKNKFSEQLPKGIEVITVNIAETRSSIRPSEATYLIAVQEEYLNEELKNRIEFLPASENLYLQRQTGLKNSSFKTIDVKPFLESIKLNATEIAVRCKISPAGSMRVDEVLSLLELDADKLAAPIRRTRVQWQFSES